MFGHSQRTHQTYAVEKVSGLKSEFCTNVTDVKLMLEMYWTKLCISERKENPVDFIEFDDDSSSVFTDSSSCDPSAADEADGPSGESQNESESDDEGSSVEGCSEDTSDTSGDIVEESTTTDCVQSKLLASLVKDSRFFCRPDAS